MEKTRVAVLISGRGSNLAALIEACRAAEFPARIALVVSDNPDAAGLVHARKASIATAVVDRRRAASRSAFEAEVQSSLTAARIDLVCLAGFMQVLSPAFVEAWRDRMLNIHPSLLPAFPGLDTHARALAQGVRIHGASVHFVRSEVDRGPIVAQAAVPVGAGDSAETLAARVLAAEHRLYPMALRLVASGAASVEGERVVLAAERGGEPDEMILSTG